MNVSILTSLLSMFAGPIGNLITTGIATGSAAFITYASAKGMDVSTASQVAVAGAGAAAALVNWGAGMLGVKINVINAGDNGLMVTREGGSAPRVTAPLQRASDGG